MKRYVKTTFVLSLIGLFVFSVLMCCCLAVPVQAQQVQPPSCHQTSDDESVPHNSEEKDCCRPAIIFVAPDTQISSVIPIKDSPFIYTGFVVPSFQTAYLDVQAYQTSPPYHDELPLYIKYSVYRL